MAIEIMSDALSNKIAAGEVVERPASVVKELVENSIDANSTYIKVEVYDAGLVRLKVTDDGDGMDEADAAVAFLRHATSKIKNEQDLFRIKTLGFRGEALASIASVCKLTLKTATGEGAGITIAYDGGKEVRREHSDARKGTEITVDQLFFNTPARLKYLKTVHTELGHITDCINRLSLSHPNIRFVLMHNDKVIFKTNGRGDLLQIVAQIYGLNVAKKMLPFTAESLDYQLTGYVAKPEVTRSQRNYISILCNGRFIKSTLLTQAILKGYHTLLPIGRYPVVVIQIEMDPILVDVNVHPTKLEVRFSKEKELFSLIESAIKDTFLKAQLIPSYTEPKKQKPLEKQKQPSFSFSFTNQQHDALHTSKNQAEHVLEKPDLFSESEAAIETKEQTVNSLGGQLYDHETMLETGTIENKGREMKETNEDLHAFTTEQDVTETLKTATDKPLHDFNRDIERTQTDVFETVDSVNETCGERLPVMYPIGQHHGTYIMAENEAGLFLIDQHAAQERIKYEYYRDKIVDFDPVVQPLLVPFSFDFSKQEALLIEQHHEVLTQIGVFLEPFGESTYKVSEHPQWFPKDGVEETIRDLVKQITESGQVDLKKLREHAAIKMSCKNSIKANHHLNHDDMFSLLEQLRETENPFTCPHGRPIIIKFSKYDLEKMFKRVM